MIKMTGIIDASDCIMGRLASQIAKRLLKGENIIIVNAEKAIISGRKEMVRTEFKEKRNIGSSRKGPYYPKHPHMILRRSVRGMLPYQTAHGREAYKRLKVYLGIPKELEGKELEVLEKTKNPAGKSITLGEVSKYLGG